MFDFCRTSRPVETMVPKLRGLVSSQLSENVDRMSGWKKGFPLGVLYTSICAALAMS